MPIGANGSKVVLVVFILEITSLLCLAALFSAIPVAILRRRRLLRMCGVAVTTLSGLIIAEVFAAAVLGLEKPATVTAQAAPPKMALTSSPTSSRPATTAAPVPTPLRNASPAEKRVPALEVTPTSTPLNRKPETAELRAFRTYWQGVVRVSAVALRAHDKAGEDLRSGNDVGATIELEKCRDTATGIGSRPFDRPLESKTVSDRQLLTAIKKAGDGLRNGCTSARSFLDTNAPSDFDTAQTHFAAVADALFQAESLARLKYKSLGGSPDSLLSFKDALR